MISDKLRDFQANCMAQPLRSSTPTEHMRVRITKRPPNTYGIDGESLLIGRVYNLASELAAALLLDGCAEIDDGADPRDRVGGFTTWRANEPAPPSRPKTTKPDSKS